MPMFIYSSAYIYRVHIYVLFRLPPAGSIPLFDRV